MNLNNKYTKLYEDDYHELLIKITTATYVDQLGECIETKRKELMDLPEYKIPKESLLKFQTNLLQAKKRKPHSNFKFGFSIFSNRVATLICIILAGLTLTATTVEAFKVPILNFFIRTTEIYTNIKINRYTASTAPKLPAEWDHQFYPHYIPEGFEIIKASINNANGRIVYKNEHNNIISYTTYIDNQDLFIDSENTVSKDILINGSPAKLLFKNNLSTIIFNNESSLFTLSSDIPEEELITIAEHVSRD